MANDLNRCEFIGRIGKDIELKYMTSGDAVANFSIACNESYKKKDGEKVEKVEWVNIVAFKKLAEIIGQYLKKGSKVFIAGKIQTRKWQDKNGADRYTTEIVAREMQMLDARTSDDNQSHQSAASDNQPAPQPASAMNEFDDSIPF